jgi:hypothetical protein
MTVCEERVRIALRINCSSLCEERIRSSDVRVRIRSVLDSFVYVFSTYSHCSIWSVFVLLLGSCVCLLRA